MIMETKMLGNLVKKFKINEGVVRREYIQLIFLKGLYEEEYAKKIFFNGGTAIRLVFGGTRFSEDLDFSVEGDPESLEIFLEDFFKKLEKLYRFEFTKRRAVSGLTYLLSSDRDDRKKNVFINLDFSFRERISMPSRSIIQTEYPVRFGAYVNHLSAEEILAEKVRALMTREKGRDIYDLWFLLSKGTKMVESLVVEKLKYYGIKKLEIEKLKERVEKFEKNNFVLDLKPFVAINEREKLGGVFEYILGFLTQML